MSEGGNLPKSSGREDNILQPAAEAPPLPVDAAGREAAIAGIIAESPLFDAEWYAAKHADVAKSGVPPALHYLRAGAARGWAPSPGFDGADYLGRHKDVARTGMNPLQHYMLFGKAENRAMKPADTEELNVRLFARCSLFDEAWYKAAYPDVARSRLGPARHFLKHGRDKGYNPGPKFDLAAYIAGNADVAASSINPLLHYLRFGQAEGRAITAVAAKVKPSEPLEQPALAAAPPAPGAIDTPPPGASPPDRDSANARIILQSPLFDAAWYQRFYTEVSGSGMSPELHYLRIGAAKGFAASAQFDSTDYLQRYDDVRETGINPLVHYLLFGKNELRKITPVDEASLTEQQVLAGGLFDEAWYTAAFPAVLRSKSSPLQHFLKHGRDKAHNPGPGFDAADYIASNPDVQSSRINPLLHYLQIGKAQGRAIKPVAAAVTSQPEASKPAAPPEPPKPAAGLQPALAPPPFLAAAPAPYTAEDLEADIVLLAATPLFDKSWYLIKYPEVARLGIRAAEHYLRHGATEMRQPSIYFDPQYYVIEQAPEIQGTGISPLIHFLNTGRNLGLKPRALFEFVPSPVVARALDIAAWPVAAGSMLPQGASPAWKRHAELLAQPGGAALAMCGAAVAFGTDMAAVAAARHRIAAFAVLSGLATATDVRALQNGALAAAGGDFQPHVYSGLGPELVGGSSRLADAWFAADTVLRIRLGDEAVEKRPPLVIRAFQCDPLLARQPLLVGEVPLPPAGTCFADLDLPNQLMPLLLVLGEAGGQAVELGVLPFPSFCRGGLHYSEIAGSEDLSNPIDQIRSLSDRLVKQHVTGGTARLLRRIEVDVTAASGAEPIFQPAFRCWLATAFGLAVAAAPAVTGNPPGEAYLRQSLGEAPTLQTRMPDRDGQYVLSLPADAIPAIEALVAGPIAASGSELTGNYYVADAATARPRLSVVLPARSEAFLALQPDWAVPGFPVLRRAPSEAGPEGGQCAMPGHVAIRLPRNAEPHRASTLMPFAPDAVRRLLPLATGEASSQPVDAFIRASDAASLETFIRALINQLDISIGNVTVEAVAGHAEPDALQSVLDRLLPGNARLVIRAVPGILGPDCLSDDGASAFTLFADDLTIPHDARTISTLLALAQDAATASAGCLAVRESMTKKGSLLSFESGGYFPSHVSLLAAPRLILAQPDCRSALACATYPVVANSSGFLLVRNDCLRQVMRHRAGTASPAGDDGLEFALRALGAGYHHLCTSVVRATSLKAEPKRERNDPPGLAAIAPARWSGILEQVTIIREIR